MPLNYCQILWERITRQSYGLQGECPYLAGQLPQAPLAGIRVFLLPLMSWARAKAADQAALVARRKVDALLTREHMMKSLTSMNNRSLYTRWLGLDRPPLLTRLAALALGAWLALAPMAPPLGAGTPADHPRSGPSRQDAAPVVSSADGQRRLSLPPGRGKGAAAPDRGPEIIVISPAEGQVHSGPLDIDIRFRAEDDSPIDLSTLKVTYGRLLPLDITPRVLPYASPEAIQVHRASFPAGTHTIRISVADTRGRVASRTLTLVLQ
jgi:hypothetical protein